MNTFLALDMPSFARSRHTQLYSQGGGSIAASGYLSAVVTSCCSAGSTAGLTESNGSLLPGLWCNSLHVTCGLTACTPGSAPGPTLGNEYGKTLLSLLPTWAGTGRNIRPLAPMSRKKKDSHRRQGPLCGSLSPLQCFEPAWVVRPSFQYHWYCKYAEWLTACVDCQLWLYDSITVKSNWTLVSWLPRTRTELLVPTNYNNIHNWKEWETNFWGFFSLSLSLQFWALSLL